ncbi:MAG: NAD(P)H-dependent oxidoreductase [bacterium]|nr:NAD(P)H-dependent oxidoreductase [bacterium]
MSKYLIIYANPRHDGHGGYLLEQVEKGFENYGADFETIDLYRIGYDPVLKETELYSTGNRHIDAQNLLFQEKIKTASSLLFIYPTWWQAPPAMLKGFIDRVFTSGFSFTYAYGLPVGLLKNKKAAAFTSSGSPSFYQFFTGNPALKVLLKYTLAFSGMRTRGYALGRASSLETNKKELEDIAKRIVKYLL